MLNEFQEEQYKLLIELYIIDKKRSAIVERIDNLGHMIAVKEMDKEADTGISTPQT